MPRIVADRFLGVGDAWVDIATGSSVRVRILPAGSPRAQVEWTARCEVLANLRHPMMNPLVDYGAADRDHLFEAYAARGPLPARGAAAGALLAHVARFLRRYDVALPRPLADFVVRPVIEGRSRRLRPLGVFLQRRNVFETVADVLEAAAPGGACAVAIEGSRACGLRTLRLATIRAARLKGYVPLGPEALRRFPWIVDQMLDRHVCVTTDVSDDPSLTVLLARLASAGARRHVVFSFVRPGTSPPPRVVQVDAMGVTAMAGMVFVDRVIGPSAEEVFAAARSAEGRPGLCLARLGLQEDEQIASAVMCVHESPQTYEAAPREASFAARRRARSPDELFTRSFRRAETLAAGGRHAAAERLLSRASRVLHGRGLRDQAARAWLLLGWLARDRARPSAAVEHFVRARDVASDPSLPLLATVGIATVWTDDGRLTEAEAALRTVVLAAERVPDVDTAARAAASLARCLLWHGQSEDALTVLHTAADAASAAVRARTLIMQSRAQLAQGLIPAAVRSGRSAVEMVRGIHDARTIAAAYRALAAATAAAGDRESAAAHLADGLRIARAAHLPAAALRLRLTAADIGIAGGERATITRVAARAAPWPPLMRFHARAVHARLTNAALDPATQAFISTSGAVAIARSAIVAPINPVADLETFLDLAHAAADERSAVERIVLELQTRLRAATVMVVSNAPDRRVLALAGRAWHGDPHVAWRALGGGLAVPADAAVEPAQAAEPVRYGGEIVGALAIRWTAGSLFDTTRSAALLRVAALAAAASVRAMLDRAVPQPSSGSWDDLVGDSAAAQSLRESIARAARAPFPVLIQGESGSGKELVARAVHRLGARRDRRFCALNCAALSDELIEAELFGHARGAFTGAVGERAGLFEEADGGTLFLDEIGELSARAQAKLLRVLQDGEVRRVGENVSRRVDVRIVAATNRRLEHEVSAGRFRADLRFRLDVVRIEVPPLRERAGDVPALASRFWNDAAARVGSRATLAPDAVAALARYDWPGNVRELQNVIAWMAVHSPRRGRVGPTALPSHVAHAGATPTGSFEAAREEFERRFVKAALASAGGQRARAAHALGVTRQGLAKMIRRLRIE